MTFDLIVLHIPYRRDFQNGFFGREKRHSRGDVKREVLVMRCPFNERVALGETRTVAGHQSLPSDASCDRKSERVEVYSFGTASQRGLVKSRP